jgi:hypothetical protein
MWRRLQSKFRVARIVRGLPDENGWMSWHLVAGAAGKGAVLYETYVWEESESLRRFVLINCRELAKQYGYHVHPEDMREFGRGVDLSETRPLSKA